MTTTRVLLAGTVAATAATVSLFGGVFAGGSGSAAPAPAPGVPQGRPSPAPALPQPDPRGAPGAPLGSAKAIAALQARLRADARDADALAALGVTYQQRARETGDPSWYPKSEGVLRRALALRPGDALATSALGSLALARHRFRLALRLGRRARALEPGEARHWGVVGDALVELGRYGAAFRAFDRMAALEPGVSSYARVSYARELLGRSEAAAAPMRLAVAAAGTGTETEAWTRVQLGKLLWTTGRLDAAARQYELALAAFPGYVHALDALAQVEGARGRFGRAIGLERRAVDEIPLPQFVAQLGDLLAASGREAEAQRQYALIGAIDRLLRANGVRTDLEIALVDLDHRIGVRRALARARLAHRERPSIDGDDVLAWALVRNGRCDEALHWSRRALRLGTRDALKFFHRGMAERCAGNGAAARRWFGRALALNPQFSLLWSPVARREAR